MWYSPDKYKTSLPDVNQELMNIKGGLDDREAKITLAKFLRANLGLTTELISGIITEKGVAKPPFEESIKKLF